MSDRLALIRAVQEQPGDDLPRLAYADWLEENGEAARAEFVRVEVALSHLKNHDDDWRPLFRRELELIRAHKDEWFGTARADWQYEVRRGFIEEIATRTASSVVPLADWLLGHHALQELSVWGVWAELRALLGHPLAGFLARLQLNAPSQYSSYLAWSPPLARGLPLRDRPLTLALADHAAGPPLIDELLAADHLDRLTWLDLSGNAIRAAGLRALLDGLGRFPKLTVLRLAGSSFGSGRRARVAPNVDRDGIELLASHPAMRQIKRLDLRHNRLDAGGVNALIDSPHLRGLTTLDLGEVGRNEGRRLRQRFGNAVELPEQRG